MNRYSFDCDAAYEMAVSRFTPLATIEKPLENKDIFADEFADFDNCKCGTRNEKHCPEHWL